MTIQQLIEKRDEITGQMAAEGDFQYWENEEVNRLQREIDGLAR